MGSLGAGRFALEDNTKPQNFHPEVHIQSVKEGSQFTQAVWSLGSKGPAVAPSHRPTPSTSLQRRWGHSRLKEARSGVSRLDQMV